ncbi:MAG: molybdenum cofactor guanylyltransferase [Rhodospirillales bacterium 20-64-7]|nr:MAG: molybdenum cofactor guanylyltransferase [Rhodospirillales bacterium 20-64-7]
MTSVRVAGLVLAGGESRRMGIMDKPLLPVGGRPMIAWVIEALGVVDIAISANGDLARFAAFGLPILPDGEFSGQGPLAGLLAGLDWAATLGADVLLSAPGDTPFLPADLAASLSPPPCAVESDGRKHHLIALWPVSKRHILRTMLLTSGPRRVEAFAERVGMRYHEFPRQPPNAFANVNTPTDLEAARLWVSESDPVSPDNPGQGTSI